MPKQTYKHKYIDAYVIAVNDFIKLFNYIAKRLLFNCYVVVYELNKQTKKNETKKKRNKKIDLNTKSIIDCDSRERAIR